jgi:hypothetical protein
MDKCPICKSDAQELERGLFDGYAVKYPTHGEFEFSDTVRATRGMGLAKLGNAPLQMPDNARSERPSMKL